MRFMTLKTLVETMVQGREVIRVMASIYQLNDNQIVEHLEYIEKNGMVELFKCPSALIEDFNYDGFGNWAIAHIGVVDGIMNVLIVDMENVDL